jgi:hypothetical protein
MPRLVMNPLTGRFDTVVSTLNELTNVTITSITDRDRLIWDSASSQWVNLPSVTAATHEPGGFENQTDSVLAFDSGTREFSITAAVTDWKIWVSGERFTLTGPDTETVAAATGTTYFYYDSAGALQQSSSFPSLANTAIAASIYWNNATGDYLFGEERHGISMDWATHEYLHNTVGAAYKSGGDITRTLSNTTLAGNQIALTETLYYDEDIPHTLAAWVAGTTWQKWYIDASGDWLRLATDDNLLGSNVTVPNFYTADPLLGYNDTTAGTIASIGLNDYVNVFVLGTNDKRSDYRFIVLCGQADHANTSSAYAETIDSLAFGNLPIPELKPLYQLTYQRVNAGVGCQLVRSLDIRKTRALGVPSTSASTHNALSGLQGGTVGEYYHLTAAEYGYVQAVLVADGIDYAGALEVGGTNATSVVVGNTANTLTTNIYGAEINIGQVGGTVNLLGAVNNLNATDVYVPNDLEVDGVVYADGGVDTATAVALAIGATNATVVNFGAPIDMSTNKITVGTIEASGSLVIGNNVGATTVFLAQAGQLTSVLGTLTVAQTTTLTALTASQAVFTNASKQLVSNAITGTGNVVMSASPTLSGTVGGTLSWSELQTFSAGATVAASQALTFGSGASISGTIAGTPTWSGAFHTFDKLIKFGDATGSAAGANQIGVYSNKLTFFGGTSGLQFVTDAGASIAEMSSTAITLSKPVDIAANGLRISGTAAASFYTKANIGIFQTASSETSLVAVGPDSGTFGTFAVYTSTSSATPTTKKPFTIDTSGAVTLGPSSGAPNITHTLQSGTTGIATFAYDAITLSKPVTMSSGYKTGAVTAATANTNLTATFENTNYYALTTNTNVTITCQTVATGFTGYIRVFNSSAGTITITLSRTDAYVQGGPANTFTIASGGRAVIRVDDFGDSSPYVTYTTGID